MSSISVRFNSFLFSYSIFNEHKCRQLADWSVWMDSNHRPRAYQARALATWATNRFTHRLWFFHHASLSFTSFSVPLLLWRVKSEKWRVSVEKASLFLHLIFIILSFLSVTQNRTTSESTPLKCTLAVFLVFAYLQTFDVTATPLLYITFSIERRWSSRTFRYGYLVTT